MPLATARGSEGLYYLESFHRKKGGARKLLTKEKGIFWGIFSSRKENGKALSYRLPHLSKGDGEGPSERLPYCCLTRKFQFVH